MEQDVEYLKQQTVQNKFNCLSLAMSLKTTQGTSEEFKDVKYLDLAKQLLEFVSGTKVENEEN